MAQLKPEDAETKGNHARMSSLNIKLSYSVTSEADEKDENPFDGMIEDVNKMISNVEAIHKTGQSNFNKTVNLVNSTFDKIQAIVDQERKEILKRVNTVVFYCFILLFYCFVACVVFFYFFSRMHHLKDKN